MKILITAGGQGTKMWPYSRENKPKQFQTIIGNSSLYAETINTLLEKFAPEDIYISTKHKFIGYISEQSPQIPLKNYIIEPDIAKDRGPGEGFAFLRLSMLHPDEPFFLVQSDVLRRDTDKFLQMIEDADQLVRENRKLITGGIKATEPNLGVDYLRLGAPVEGSQQDVYDVDEFVFRKSSYRETKELVENYHVVTHCNHTCWYPGLMLEAYKKYRPDWYDALMKIRDVLDKPGEAAAVEEIYATMEKGATEEVTKHIMGEGQVILLPYRWIDIGTWGSVYEFMVEGDGGNFEDGNVVAVDTTGSLIKTSSDKKLIAVAGVEDLVIVDTEDALLIIPKDKMEKIKDIQKILAENGKEFL